MYIIICKSTNRTSNPGAISLLSDNIGQALMYQYAEQAEQIARQFSAAGNFRCAVVPLSQLQFFGNV